LREVKTQDFLNSNPLAAKKPIRLPLSLIRAKEKKERKNTRRDDEAIHNEQVMAVLRT
jgi:hypothetical protein